jgi:hypothetical protein
MAAASPDVIRPNSGNSAISIAAETGPMPGALIAVGLPCRQVSPLVRCRLQCAVRCYRSEYRMPL